MSDYSLQEYKDYRKAFLMMVGMAATTISGDTNFGDLVNIVDGFFEKKVKEMENDG